MKSTNEPGFTIVDRRGQNRAPEPEPISVGPQVAVQRNQTWISTAYIYTLQQHPEFGMLMLGRAIGERSDGKPFLADFLLFPQVTDNTIDWRPLAKKRLDTFLNCECSIAHGACAMHKLSLPQWQKQDMERMQRMAREPVPRALEVMYNAEIAKQKSNLVVTR